MNKTSKTVILIIFCLALLVRFSLLYATRDWFYDSANALTHTDIARNIVAGNGFSYTTPEGPQPLYFYQPGYAVFLSIPLWLFGEEAGFFAMKVIQIILSSIGVFMAFSIGRRLFDILPGIIFAFLWATLFPEAYFTVQLVPDSLMPFFVLLATYLFLRGLFDKKTFFWLSAIVIGIASLIKSDPLFLPVFFFFGLLVWDFSSWRKHLKISVIMIAIVLSLLIPEGMRQYRNFGTFTITRAPSIWHGLWQGFGEFENPFGAVIVDELAHKLVTEEYGVRVDYKSPEYTALVRDKSLKALRENPWWYITMLPKRFLKMVYIGGYGHWNLYFRDSSIMRIVVRHWLPKIYKISLLLLSIGCIIVFRKQWRKIFLVLSIYFYGIAVHLPIFWQPIYLIQTEFPLLLLAALFLAFLIRKFFKQSSIFTFEVQKKALKVQ